jgi:peptide/nickel transport system substrate-binding protein
MKEKTVWPPLTCLVSAALLLASCSSSLETTTPANTTVPSTSVPVVVPGPTVAPTEKPEYGGTVSLYSLVGIGVFDPVATGQFMGSVGFMVNEQYVAEDWTRGSAGTGEIEWVPNTGVSPDTCTGVLAESWEMPTIGTVVFKVRRGVHWALNPDSEASRLMNGREVTADDWIASFRYLMQHPRSMIKTYAPQLVSTATTEKTGPWEVTVKTPIDPLVGWNWLAWGTAMYFLLPPEVVNKYGDMRDWRNVVGTGPFMLTDYVDGSSATLVKNPNYWQTDPVGSGKGNRIPYLDGVKILVIPDISTAQAALRAARVDAAFGANAEDAKSLMRSIPNLKNRSCLPLNPAVIVMRMDKAGLPYKDKRVRQALMMATDLNGLKDDFFGGEAETLAFPVTRESKRAYMPLEEMPESAQELYRYNPGRARQLLAEAGYPGGFGCRMIVASGFGFEDQASVYRAMWAKVGVDLEVQPRTLSVFNSIAYARSYEDMMFFFPTGATQYPGCLGLGFFGASFYVNDPVIDAARQEIQKHVIIDMPGADSIYRELLPYIVEQAYFIPRPSPRVYTLWWPWLKNFYGEMPSRFGAYHWIDEDLKEVMTGRR